MKKKISNIGSFLKKRRKQMNLTQVQVAKKIGIDETTLGRIESGIISIDDKIIALSEILNFSLTEIYDFNDSAVSYFGLDDFCDMAIEYLKESNEPDKLLTFNLYLANTLKDISTEECYQICAENNAGIDYGWLYTKGLSLDEFIEKVTDFIYRDAFECKAIEIIGDDFEFKSEKSDIFQYTKELLSNVERCVCCNKNFIKYLEYYGKIGDDYVCESCKDEECRECIECGELFIKEGRFKKCTECRN